MSGSSRQGAQWSSRPTFILGAVGAAVGLGNFWKFPYMAGQNGGGAFVAVYLLTVLAIIAPLVMAEILIGRRGKASAVGSPLALARAEGLSPAWSAIGWLGIAAAFLIMTFYSVIGGWVIAYVVEAAKGTFAGADVETIGSAFQALLSDPLQLTLYHAAFTALTMLIVIPGLNRGIEPAINTLMPLLFAMLVGLVIYAGLTGAFEAGMTFLFIPDFSKITPAVLLSAVGQGFFSVGVALAILLTYGAYLGPGINIARASLLIAVADTAVAILAGMLIFPIVFAHGLDPGQGPTLLFVTLPIAFSDMPGGHAIAVIFFALLFIAAVTSSIGLVEALVASSVERMGLSRPLAAGVIGLGIFVLGLGTVVSFNLWKDVHPLAALSGFETATVFDLVDYLTSNIMLPLGGLLIALFVGWRLEPEGVRAELGFTSKAWYGAWLFALRYLAPVSLAGILLANWL